MITSIRCLFVLVILVCCASFQAAARSQTVPKKAAPTGSISGRVTLQGKGKAGILIGLNAGPGGGPSGAAGKPMLKAVSGADGHYHISEVPGGFYRVVPIAPELVPKDVSTNPYGPRGKGLQLAEGENVDNIDFELVRGAVITGKVTHSDGRPVVEERIIAQQEELQARRGSTSSQSGSSTTDDRGVYRLYGLPPGKYKVSVGQADDAFFSSIGRGRASFERVFYPDVTEAEDARVIDLSEGGEAANIDITIGKRISGHAVTGVVLDGETSQPLPNMRFNLQRMLGQGGGSMAMGAVSNEQGNFRIDNVPPGRYSVSILPQPTSQLHSEAVPFEVIDQDVTGVTIRTSKGAIVSGVVALEGTSDKSVLASLAGFRLHVYVRQEANSGSGIMQRSSIGPDGSFRVGGLQQGMAMFSLTGENGVPPKGFSQARIERDGVVQARGVEVKAGEHVSGVRVVFNYATGIIRGSLNVENGPIPAGARVMVWVTRPGDASFRLNAQEADSRGHFMLEGVPAGNYDLRASVFIPSGGQRLAAQQPITVADGTTTEAVLTITLDPKREPVP